jgi:hypothetical protein
MPVAAGGGCGTLRIACKLQNPLHATQCSGVCGDCAHAGLDNTHDNACIVLQRRLVIRSALDVAQWACLEPDKIVVPAA